jgi:hypothetical protein
LMRCAERTKIPPKQKQASLTLSLVSLGRLADEAGSVQPQIGPGDAPILAFSAKLRNNYVYRVR